MALPLSLHIALQHLLHRRRQTLVSLVGVALGVGFFIGISSMMQGFQRDFVARIIDVQPHIIIKDEVREPPRQPVDKLYAADAAVDLRGLKPREEVRGLRGARNILATLEDMPGVHAAPALSGNLLLRFGGKDVSVSVTGIDPMRERKVTHLEKDLLSGSLDALYTTSNAIILGEGVAKKAGIRNGDLISAVSPVGVSLKMKVVGIFRSNITLMDNFDTYVLLKKAQALQNRSNVLNRINVRLEDVEQASPLAAQIERQFGYRSEPWQEQSRNVLSIFVIQNGITYS